MGEIADMILEGILCEQCGGLVDIPENDEDTLPEAPGFPRKCSSCKPKRRRRKRRNSQIVQAAAMKALDKIDQLSDPEFKNILDRKQ